MAIVEGMRRTPPWESPVYRNRHGRGIRTPTFGVRLPRYRTRSGMFDDMVAAQIRRLHEAWPDLVDAIQFAVEDVPPSSPAPWEDQPDLLSHGFAAGRGIPARIVLYRLPMQTRCRTRMELQWGIRDELVSRLADLTGRRPDEIDPDWGM
ncbi:MAG: metallopeptidase family protein [Bifidobacterium minimum]|nr:metallopeptidase family protein [Bifidobacterium minimum]MCH4159159.1 metallopeptidase family protein [Bifidobacterium minimum]